MGRIARVLAVGLPLPARPFIGKPHDALNRLTQMSSDGIYTMNQAFEPLGDVKASSQLTAGGAYGFTYQYNLAGALTTEVLPSVTEREHGLQVRPGTWFTVFGSRG